MHFLNPTPTGTQTLPAVIVDVHPDETVDLFVMAAFGSVTRTGVPHADEPKSGCWMWPPRLEETTPTESSDTSQA